MKTQISRDGFRPEQRYSGVYQQQGRMLTDRDWNEMVDVLKARIDGGLADALGAAARVAGTGGAAPFAYEDQADLPSPPALPAGQPYRLYLDSWERPVAALEDPGLRDAALTGPADAATRTQTLAQIKWAPIGKDPENPSHNPPRGNATLTVEVAGSPAPANFLLRVEVHHVVWTDGAAPSEPSVVEIKWSRENGARQLVAAEAPESFTHGQWAWEIWEPDAEKSLGYAFGGWAPVRGSISGSFVPAEAPAGAFVRRWDGACHLQRSGSSWTVSTMDAGGGTTAPGAEAKVEDGKLKMKTGSLRLALDLDGKVFLPGDAWLVPVRGSIHRPGMQIAAGLQPSGVTHRYLTLASVDAGGQVTLSRRQEPFPPIGRLTGDDIDYDGSGCENGLFTAAHDSVGKALNRLWQLDAEHLAYGPPAGGGSLFQGHAVTDARQALDLLGDVHAARIAYEGRSGVPEVQSALGSLLQRPVRPSGWITVGALGQFLSVDSALTALLHPGASDIRLWLLPGDHELGSAAGSQVDGLLTTALTLGGSGQASRLRVRGSTSLTAFAAVTFQRLDLTIEDRLSLVGGDVRFVDNRIAGTPSSSKKGLVRLSGVRRALFRGNRVEAGVLDAGASAPSAGIFLVLDGPPRRLLLEGNEILGFVSLYGIPGDELSAAERQSASALMGSFVFDPGADQDLVARSNRMTGFRVSSALLALIRAKAPLAPLYRRVVLSNNSIESGANQLAACMVSLNGNLLSSPSFGWILGEELLFTGNTARASVTVDVLRRQQQAAGNSSRITLRVPPPLP